jgi:hypothetical protein
MFHFKSGTRISNKKGRLTAILSNLKGFVYRKGSAMNKTLIIMTGEYYLHEQRDRSMTKNCDPMSQGSNLIVVPRLIIYLRYMSMFICSAIMHMVHECY